MTNKRKKQKNFAKKVEIMKYSKMQLQEFVLDYYAQIVCA